VLLAALVLAHDRPRVPGEPRSFDRMVLAMSEGIQGIAVTKVFRREDDDLGALPRPTVSGPTAGAVPA
jgi:hypothetical protein